MNRKKVTITVIVIIFLLFSGISLYMGCKHYSDVMTIYEEAEKLIENSDYVGALEKLEGIETDKYRDTVALMELCKAHISYEEGNVESAYWDMKYLDFKYLTSKQQESLDTFVNEVELAYDESLEQERIAEQKEYEEKVREGIPFVGMSERDIANTSLGSPSSDIRHNYECISGKQYEANLYDFKEGGNTIFTARCVQGKVIQVWDHRENPIKTYESSNSNTGKDDKEDAYDVYKYDDPEEFYYDNYDDFDGYEDAEDYWDDAWE